MKGAAPRALSYDTIAKVQSLTTEITRSSTPEGFEIGVVFEFVPLHKVASVPSSATAFRRNVAPNIMILIAWNKDGEDSVDKARGYANAVVDILMGDEANKEGYANYGASVTPLIALVAGKVMSTRVFRCGRGGLRSSRYQGGKIQASVWGELSEASGDQEAL